MKKGARVVLTVFVQGEDEPAHDFLKLVLEAITWAVNRIPKFPGKKGLTVEIEKMFEDTMGPEEV